MVQTGRLHHLGIVVDGGPKSITFLIDGKLCDGGNDRQFGWGRFSPNLYGVDRAKTLRIGSTLIGKMERLRLYSRGLRTSEVVCNRQAGP